MLDNLPLRRRAEKIATNKPMFVSGGDLTPKKEQILHFIFLTFGYLECCKPQLSLFVTCSKKNLNIFY